MRRTSSRQSGLRLRSLKARKPSARRASMASLRAAPSFVWTLSPKLQ
jgi:hypothetical protein